MLTAIKPHNFIEVKPEQTQRRITTKRELIRISRDKRSDSDTLYMGKRVMDRLDMKNGSYVTLLYDAAHDLIGIKKSHGGHKVSSNKFSITGMTKMLGVNLKNGENVYYEYGGIIGDIAYFKKIN